MYIPEQKIKHLFSISQYSVSLLAERYGFRILGEAKTFLQNVKTGSGAHPTLPFNGHPASFLVVKRPGPDVDDPPPAHAEVKNEWNYASTPLYAFTAWTVTTLPFT
jgi:hypothetical protein